MPDQGKSSGTRVVAVGGLIVLFIAVIAVIATSSGSSDSDDSGSGVKDSGPDIEAISTVKDSKAVETAIERGEYIVQPGDNLTTISEATGVDIETLMELNPELDPQTLGEGQRIRLK